MPSPVTLPFFPSVQLTWSQIGMYSGAAFAVYLVGMYLYLWTYREYSLSYWNVPGPKAEHWFWGNLRGIAKAGPLEYHLKWMQEYGHTIRYKFLFGGNRFCTSDTTALNYILAHSDSFEKPAQTRKVMTDILGNGVLIAEGDDHRRQRKILQPSFNPSAIKNMVPIFYDKAYELKELLQTVIEDESIEAAPTPAKDEDKVAGGRKIDIMKFLGMATIDAIGLAGFNYDFRALKEPNNELSDAYRKMFSDAENFTFVGLVQALVPYADRYPTTRMKAIWGSQATTRRIGRKLIEDKKKVIREAHAGGLEKGQDIGKDLLSLCLKANMSADLDPKQKLSDEETLAQITTFMLAGNETSSTALTWTLYSLALRQDFQEKLRKECMAIDEERPSLDTLNTLPFLEACLREALRMLPPVPSTIREANKDVVIPLGKPSIGRDGKSMDSIKLQKGTTIFIPILAVNTNKDIWGEDAAEFNPDRFLEPSKAEAYNSVPGVWGNLMSFLGGTRNCIGYRFALAEMKAILFVLIRNFTFEELPSKPVVEKKSSIVMRSRIVGEETAGLQMPLMIKPISA